MKFKTHQPDTDAGETFSATLDMGDACCISVSAVKGGRVYVSTAHPHGSATVTLPTGGAIVLAMLLQQAASAMKPEGVA